MAANERVVVVGGVAAGMSAASQIRRRRPEMEVVVFERGPVISYGACGMPYNIADPERSMEDLVVLTAETARRERGIQLHLEHEVLAIDIPSSTVTVRNTVENSERTESFDKLVIATGARSVVPPIEGIDGEGVFVLRTLANGSAIKKRLDRGAKRAVIIGAGYIGMEMAHVLTERGLEVHVVEKLDQVLPGWHSETVKAVHRTLDRHGVAVELGTSVQSIDSDSQGRVTQLVTDRGAIETDLVVVATGVRPNVSLASDAGLRLGDSGALWVDHYQRTSQQHVWAAGDCCEAFHRVLRRNAWIPLGTTANKQGRVAGANAAGSNTRFGGIVGSAGCVVFDLEVARTGLSFESATTEGFEPVTVTIRQRSRANGYPGGTPILVTLVADGPTGLLLGAEIAGTDGAALRINILATALSAHMTVTDLQSLDLVYAPPFAPVWDPVLVAANQLSKKVGR